MNWFYELDGQQMGPISEAELLELFRGGRIKGSNLVWREGMAEWQPLQTALPMAPPPLNLDPRRAETVCVECGQTFPADELITLNKSRVCARCKPVFLQRLAEGANTVGGAGLWREGNKLVTRSETPMPDRCVKCNAPAHGYQLKRTLYWHHPAYILLLFCNILVLLVVLLIVRKKAVLHVGLCEIHKRARKRTWLIFGASLAGCLLLLGVSGLTDNGWVALVAGLGILASIIWIMIKGPVIRATKINKEGNVWVSGVCKEFLAELPER